MRLKSADIDKQGYLIGTNDKKLAEIKTKELM